MQQLKLLAITVPLLILLIVTVYGGFIIYFSWPITLGDVDKAGVFGDSFGILTALFSGLAFGGIILTILLQREDISIQRDELKLTREEVKKQNFESTFFQMLRLHNDIVNAIDLSKKSSGVISITTGRDCFVTFFQRFKNNYQSAKKLKPDGTETELIESAYDVFWAIHQNELGHYFRYLYNIFKFIKASEIENKRLYSNIIRAQLSDQELLILFYNCLYKFGIEKFKPLAVEFAIFDNLPMNILLDREHCDLYPPEAFESQTQPVQEADK